MVFRGSKKAQTVKRAGNNVYDPKLLRRGTEIRVHNTDTLQNSDYVITAPPHRAPKGSLPSGNIITARRIWRGLLGGRRLGTEEPLSLVDIGVLPIPYSETTRFSNRHTTILRQP